VTQTFKNFDEYWEIQTLPFARAGKACRRSTKRSAPAARPPARQAPAADGTITYSATAMAGKARKP
jgi:hypothetical protein